MIAAMLQYVGMIVKNVLMIYIIIVIIYDQIIAVENY